MSELYHHGIKNQKWGVRRYQNPDGSLTEAGRKRYGYGVGKLKAGSTVRRVSGRKYKDDNPVGLYVFTQGDQKAYKDAAYYLPSVNPPYGFGNNKKAKITQYKFVKDAIIDPEDYTADFKEPIIILNKDIIKKEGSYNFKTKK